MDTGRHVDFDLCPSSTVADPNLPRLTAETATIIGDYLYIDGGEISQLVDGENLEFRDSNPVNDTLSIDMSKSWDPEDVEMQAVEKSSQTMMRQTLWKDESSDSFYIWGGVTSYGRDPPPQRLWRFTADGKGRGSWSNQNTANMDTFETMRRSNGGAFVSTPDAGFHFGGISNQFSSFEAGGPVPGYVYFNYTTREFLNGTDGPWDSYGTLYGGTAAYAPSFGPNGVVFLVGGTSQPVGGGDMGYRSMQNISFMDPVTKDFYYQRTTGSPPPDRQFHCMVGVESPNGTYEMFVYAGRNDNSNRNFDDLYVLSVPGFVWRQADYESESPRNSQACVVAGGRQMITVGGFNTHLQQGNRWTDPDPFPQGLGIFDLTKMSWKDSYDADAGDYESPDVIRQWYDEGGVDDIDWTNDDVAALFQEAVDDNRGGGGDEDDDDDDDDGGSSNVGAIAGGAVGGVVGLAAIGALIFFLLRRRKQKKNNGEKGGPNGPSELDAGGSPSQNNMVPSTAHSASPPTGNAHSHYENYGLLSSKADSTSPPPPPPKPSDHHQPYQDYDSYNNKLAQPPAELHDTSPLPPPQELVGSTVPAAELDGVGHGRR